MAGSVSGTWESRGSVDPVAASVYVMSGCSQKHVADLIARSLSVATGMLTRKPLRMPLEAHQGCRTVDLTRVFRLLSPSQACKLALTTLESRYSSLEHQIRRKFSLQASCSLPSVHANPALFKEIAVGFG